MNPTPSKFKKFLLPSLLVVIVIIGGLLIWKTKAASNQQAALFKTTTLQTACKINIGPNGLPLPGVPSIKVISPNGGETFTAGQQITVMWSTCNIPANASMQILLEEMNPNGTGQGYGLVANGTLNDGSQNLNLFSAVQWNQVSGGAQMQFGKKYRIKIMLTNNSGVVDVSDNLFTINSKLVCKPTDPATIRVDSPNGGEVFTAGQQITVRWSSCNVPASSQVIVLLESSTGVIPYLTNDPNIPSILSSNDGIETFVIPTSNYSGLTPGLYKARVTTTQVASIDWSDNFFMIQ